MAGQNCTEIGRFWDLLVVESDKSGYGMTSAVFRLACFALVYIMVARFS